PGVAAPQRPVADVEPQPAALLVGAVAAVAPRLQQRPDVAVELGRVAGGGAVGECEQDKQQAGAGHESKDGGGRKGGGLPRVYLPLGCPARVYPVDRRNRRNRLGRVDRGGRIDGQGNASETLRGRARRRAVARSAGADSSWRDPSMAIVTRCPV